MEGIKKHELTKLSALIWGCIHECSYCEGRRKKEIERKIQFHKEKERRESLLFIDRQIEKLQQVREAILSGEDVNVYDYCFEYEVEEDIAEDAIDNFYDSYEPRGWR